jgi:fructokinase
MNSLIIGIGEALWDLLPTGPHMGGAPANFACHAHALGAESMVISRVGDDPLGAELLRNLERLGVSTAGISIDPAHATGTVQVALGDDGQARYTISENVGWDHLEATDGSLAFAKRAAAVCFGSLGQRSEMSRAAIRCMIGHAAPGCLRVFDANLRQDFHSPELIDESLRMADVVKLNDEELPVVCQMLGIRRDTPKEQLAELWKRYSLRAIACTRGGRGSVLLDAGGFCEHAGLTTRVADTIGAGDSFTAALTLGLLKRWPLERISETANRVAAHVCSRPGGTPPMDARLKDLFEPTRMPA